LRGTRGELGLFKKPNLDFSKEAELGLFKKKPNSDFSKILLVNITIL
jgi:hypothetical protein